MISSSLEAQKQELFAFCSSFISTMSLSQDVNLLETEQELMLIRDELKKLKAWGCTD